MEALLEIDVSTVSMVTNFPGEQLLLLKRVREFKQVSFECAGKAGEPRVVTSSGNLLLFILHVLCNYIM